MFPFLQLTSSIEIKLVWDLPFFLRKEGLGFTDSTKRFFHLIFLPSLTILPLICMVIRRHISKVEQIVRTNSSKRILKRLTS